MNNNIQPNNFNNQNGTLPTQPNAVPVNNVPVNNVQPNNVSGNNMSMNNIPTNNVPVNNVQTVGYPTQNTPMNQQYSQGYPQQNMNFNNMTSAPQQPKGNNKVLIIVLLLVVVAIVVGVVLFLGKDKEKEKNEDNKPTNENVNQDNEEPEEEPPVEEENNPTTSPGTGTNLATPDSGLTSITSPISDINGPFLMSIEDVFTITGRGTVVTGRVERGTVKIGDEIQIVGIRDEIITTKVAGIEMFREQLDYAEVGDNAGIVLENVNREDVERGQVLVKPNSISNKTKFHAYIEVLTADEGGRHTPFFVNYRPQFYFRTIDITGTVIAFEEGFDQISPGDKVDVTVELITPVAMEKGTEFSIREGGRTVAKGIVTEVLE